MPRRQIRSWCGSLNKIVELALECCCIWIINYCIKVVPHVINSRALTSEKPCINKAIHALLMHGYATFNMIVPGPQICCRHELCTAGPRTSIVSGNYVRETSVKRRNKIVQKNNAKCSNCFQFLCNNSDRTSAFGLDFQHLSRDLANVNAWKTMFDPYIVIPLV